MRRTNHKRLLLDLLLFICFIINHANYNPLVLGQGLSEGSAGAAAAAAAASGAPSNGGPSSSVHKMHNHMSSYRKSERLHKFDLFVDPVCEQVYKLSDGQLNKFYSQLNMFSQKSNHGLAGCFGENGFNFDPNNRDQLSNFCSARTLYTSQYGSFVTCANQIWRPAIDADIDKALRERIQMRRNMESADSLQADILRDIIQHIHAEQDEEIASELALEGAIAGESEISSKLLGKILVEAASQSQLEQASGPSSSVASGAASNEPQVDLSSSGFSQGDTTPVKTAILPILVVPSDSISTGNKPFNYPSASSQVGSSGPAGAATAAAAASGNDPSTMAPAPAPESNIQQQQPVQNNSPVGVAAAGATDLPPNDSLNNGPATFSAAGATAPQPQPAPQPLPSNTPELQMGASSVGVADATPAVNSLPPPASPVMQANDVGAGAAAAGQSDSTTQPINNNVTPATALPEPQSSTPASSAAASSSTDSTTSFDANGVTQSRTAIDSTVASTTSNDGTKSTTVSTTTTSTSTTSALPKADETMAAGSAAAAGPTAPDPQATTPEVGAGVAASEGAASATELPVAAPVSEDLQAGNSRVGTAIEENGAAVAGGADAAVGTGVAAPEPLEAPAGAAQDETTSTVSAESAGESTVGPEEVENQEASVAAGAATDSQEIEQPAQTPPVENAAVESNVVGAAEVAPAVSDAGEAAPSDAASGVAIASPVAINEAASGGDERSDIGTAVQAENAPQDVAENSNAVAASAAEQHLQKDTVETADRFVNLYQTAQETGAPEGSDVGVAAAGAGAGAATAADGASDAGTVSGAAAAVTETARDNAPQVHDVIVMGPHVEGDDKAFDYEDHHEHHSDMNDGEDEHLHEDHHAAGAMTINHEGDDNYHDDLMNSRVAASAASADGQSGGDAAASAAAAGSDSGLDSLVEGHYDYEDHSDHEHLLSGLKTGDIIHVDAGEHDSSRE